MFILVSGASGSGKSTIIKEILKHFDKNIALLPSSTSRKIRPGEIEGENYYYLTKEEFEDAIKNGEFIEYQKVFENGNYYGVSRNRYNDYSKKYPLLIKDVDVLGVENIKKEDDIDTLSIYIDVGDDEELRKRLINRGDDLKDIELRIKRKRFEDGYKNKYDYIVLNDDIEKAILKTKKIIEKEIEKRSKK
ncbi:MAG: guanylate kinase [Clostridia bacterium]|nr:guanylate kinase [Clostridia bacterium]